jgi:hypothetical protein
MPDLTVAIPRLRKSTVAILTLRITKPATVNHGKPEPAQFRVNWGSGFCVLTDRYVVTAFHVLNDGATRDANSKSYALVVPKNDDPLYWFPVVAFPVERPDVDMAVLEIGGCPSANVSIPALPVSFKRQPDGIQVLTMGFPAPEITGLNADAQGNFLGGQFFLKSHANKGIVAAHYVVNGAFSYYELNVGWHHGESGGAITVAGEQPTVFSLMQRYRHVQGPHGIIPGPRQGLGLSEIQKELTSLGVVGV